MNQIRPEVAELLAQYTRWRLPGSASNPLWYWLDFNAEHGAEKRVIEWMLRDAERYEEMSKIRHRQVETTARRV